MHRESVGIVDNALNAAVFNGMAAVGGLYRKKLIAQSRHADRVSKKLLMRMVRKNQNTEVGKKYHFRDIHSVKDYQKKVPLTTFDDYEEYVDRLAKNGEQGLMTTDKIVYFADTSGTISVYKKIPVSKRFFMPTLLSGCVLYWLIRKEMRRRGFGSSSAWGLNMVETPSWETPSGIRHGYISSYAIGKANVLLSKMSCFPEELFNPGEGVDARYIKVLFALAERDLTYMWAVFISTLTDLMAFIVENHKMLIRDLARGKIDPSVEIPADIRLRMEKKLRPNPKRAKELRDEFEHPERGPIIPRIWKRMSVIVAVGSGEFFPYVEKMRSYIGPDIAFCHEFLGASEALFGTVTAVNDDRYLFVPDGSFLEFLPLNEEGEGDVRHPLTLKKLREGENYEIVLTNLSGLYRYCIKDVFRVAGFSGEAPYLQFAYRKQQMLNIAGAHVNTEQVRSAIKGLETSLNIHIADYTLYEDVEFIPSRVVLFLEPDAEEEWSPKTVAAIPQLLDKLLKEYNEDFRYLMGLDEISPSFVRVLPKGTYRKYREEQIAKGVPINQIKTVRVIQKPQQLDFFCREASWSPRGAKRQ